MPLLDFLLQILKQRIVKELLDADSQAVTEFFDCRDCRAVVSAVDDVVQRRLGYAAYRTEFVDGDVVEFALLYFPKPL